MKIKPDIIHEDESFVIVNKPPRYLAIPDRYEVTKPNVADFLKRKYDEILTVHRIDKETSGIMVFARNEAAHRELSRQFQERTVTKIYAALCDGVFKEKTGIIDAPLLNNLASSGKVVVNRSGKPSVTHYEAVEQFRDFALVEFDLKTGRTHQIRAHALHIGHPLMTDAIYGRREEFMLSEIMGKRYKSGKNHTERSLLSRSALHAARLTFRHPTSGETVTFSADLPKDMRAVVAQLRKQNAV